jgi:hypothetical protein
MIVSVSSLHQDAILAISGVTGKQVLLGAAAGASHWQGTLPSTQDYSIQVSTKSAALNFSLQVVIPSVIAFAPGATATSVQGNTGDSFVVSYVAHAEKGQTMLVNIDSPQSDVFLTIYGFQDGQPLIRSVMGSAQFRGTLPATQDYIIEAVRTGQPGDFNLQVTVPRRIQFQPGAISASVNGSVSAHAVTSYILGAQAGQTMTVTLTSPAHNVLLTIYGLDDGSPLVRYVSGASSWSGTLPATQDYVVEAFATGNTSTFTLKATVK